MIFYCSNGKEGHRNAETLRHKAQVPCSDSSGNRERMTLPSSAVENHQGLHRPEIKSKKTVASTIIHHESAAILIHI